MPIYDFECTACGKKFEGLVARFSSPAPPCEACGAPARRADVTQLRRFGENPNACSLALHINWPGR